MHFESGRLHFPKCATIFFSAFVLKEAKDVLTTCCKNDIFFQADTIIVTESTFSHICRKAEKGSVTKKTLPKLHDGISKKIKIKKGSKLLFSDKQLTSLKLVPL